MDEEKRTIGVRKTAEMVLANSYSTSSIIGVTCEITYSLEEKIKSFKMEGIRKNSRIGFLTLGFLVGCLFSCQREKSLPPAAEEQNPISDSTIVTNVLYEDLEGNPIRLSDYKGKRVVLHFWATWCRPCIEEMPSLIRVEPLLEKENYQILLISEESVDEIKEYQQRTDSKLTLLRYSEALSKLNIHALPTTYILNEDGEKVKEISGRIDWDAEHTVTELINLH